MKKRVLGKVVTVALSVGLSLAPVGPAYGAVNQGVSQQENWATHVVQAGDSLWKIGQRYGLSVQQLKELNGLTSDILYVGQKLLVKQAQVIHVVQNGDTPWLISRQYGVPLDDLLAANNLTQDSVLYVGQRLVIPTGGQASERDFMYYTVKEGDTPWLISRRYGVPLSELMALNNLDAGSYLYVGQVLKIPKAAKEEATKPYVTYTIHTVQRGDTIWNLAIKYGLPAPELLEINGLTEKSTLYVGQKLTIPVHHIPVKSTPGPQYGELLDWWTEAQYVWTRGEIATVIDFYTGKKWLIRRSYGAFHADVEPLTKQDSAIMKEVFGGTWTWKVRPVIIEVDGRRIAASADAMPHDVQTIYDNDFPGHSDIHFWNSTRHKDNKVDPEHQRAVHIAAGK